MGFHYSLLVVVVRVVPLLGLLGLKEEGGREVWIDNKPKQNKIHETLKNTNPQERYRNGRNEIRRSE